MSLLACQLDARLRTLDTRVLWCRPHGDRFLAALEDSPLYPEGGGQPADHGWVGGVPVLDVQTVDDQPVLTLAAAVPQGPARVELDWARRFDHMQQHTGQHLITALALARLGRPTVGFHLGVAHTLIDMSGPPLSDAERAQLESWANAEILADRPVRPRVVQADELEALRVRTRGYKAKEEVRLIEIEGIDLNTCGGTHVRSTLELQAVAIPIAERYKGGTRLHVWVGGRVLGALNHALELERQLTAALCCAPEEHPARVRGMLEERQADHRAQQALTAELAELLAAALVASPDSPGHLHRPGASAQLLKAVALAARARAPERIFLLTGGEAPEVPVVMVGPAELLRERGPAALAALGGRGGGAGVVQGRAPGLEGLERGLGVLRGGVPGIDS